jgi:hypothetical protein
MQALRGITDSIQDSKDKLLDIPRKLWSRMDGQDENILGHVSGEYNYHFTFRLEGGGFFQTGVLVASAENMPGGLPLPLRCTWKRKIGEMLVEIPSVTSNMYQISADDVGTDICVEVCPADADDGHLGIALGQIGPFELDPSTRRSLDNALGSGGTRFTVSQSTAPGDRSSLRTDMAVVVASDGVTIVPIQAGKENKSKEILAEYSPDYPKVIIHPLDTCKFQLIMSASGTFHLQAPSRTARDLIALTIRCFHARKYLPTADILSELFPVQSASVTANAAEPVQNGHLDECIVLERIAKELNRAMVQKDVAEKVLRNTHHEKKQLQSQLEETIRGFQEVITGLQGQCDKGSSASPVPLADLQSQLRETQELNKHLESQLQSQRKQFEDAKAAAAKRATGGSASIQNILQIREKRDMLKIRLQELQSTNGMQRDQADQVHTLELKRLRQEVEDLHNTKEDLRRQLQDNDRSNQELQENFLYVKGQRDKVQAKQSESTTGKSHEEKELVRFREAVEAITAERNCLNLRMDGTQKELEKEKSYHESSLERLMAATAKLREDKDRSEQDVQRLSQLYAAAAKQVQEEDRDGLGITRMDSIAEPPVASAQDQEEIKQLQAQLVQVDESFKKREQENESLKNRIRKLAVA